MHQPVLESWTPSRQFLNTRALAPQICRASRRLEKSMINDECEDRSSGDVPAQICEKTMLVNTWLVKRLGTSWIETPGTHTISVTALDEIVGVHDHVVAERQDITSLHLLMIIKLPEKTFRCFLVFLPSPQASVYCFGLAHLSQWFCSFELTPRLQLKKMNVTKGHNLNISQCSVKLDRHRPIRLFFQKAQSVSKSHSRVRSLHRANAVHHQLAICHIYDLSPNAWLHSLLAMETRMSYHGLDVLKMISLCSDDVPLHNHYLNQFGATAFRP